jgi:hypothetical protein
VACGAFVHEPIRRRQIPEYPPRTPTEATRMSPAGAGLTTAHTKGKGASATPLLRLRAPLLYFLAADVGAHLESATEDQADNEYP